MADAPVWAGHNPFTGAYQKRQFTAGLPGGVDDNVFSALAFPPELPTAEGAEE